MAVHGLAQATGWSANVGLMANWTRRAERGTLMAVWGTCYQLGSALAKGFAAFVFGALGLAWSFWGSGMVLAGVCVLFWFWAHEEPAACGLPPVDDDEEHPPSAAAPPSSGDHILRTVMAMGVIYFSFKFLRYALDSWAALIATERFSLSTTTAGYISSTFDWVGFAGVFLAGWVSDRWFGGRRAPVIFLGTVGTLGATLVLLTAGLQTPWLFAAALGLVGLMLMGPDSLIAGAGAMDVGGRRWAVVAAGVINGLGSIGPIVQEETIGWLKMHGGVEDVLRLLVAMAAVATAGTGLFWLSVRRRGLAL
jgi:sugar phosphate permease